MADHGITCSMSRAGNVWDNSAMESFFSSLKTERTARKVYRTRNAARADVFDYIERFYNPTRRHSTLGYLSPVEFERQAALPQPAVHETGSRPRQPICSQLVATKRRVFTEEFEAVGRTQLSRSTGKVIFG
ncbi:Mobile element protein [Rubellimicrobium mesophilum DSM 19309]|uniref:Mobile element protein n=1 Tax=Rubellimicrobium mesophilum DSM 19309 TaxID=442562 RepID=A0A017HS75_9RHOB|nr:Mobile element protein [Rubellimicrobium mesophilum DSM 19309]